MLWSRAPAPSPCYGLDARCCQLNHLSRSPLVLLAILHLERSIRFVKERLSPQQTVVRGLNFHLNAADLDQIQQARRQGQALHLPSRFLRDLRAYLIFPAEGTVPLTLTIATYYYASPAADGEALIRSAIALEGDVLHQICDRCLADPELALALTSAHYWLIDQLLTRLKLDVQAALAYLTRGLQIVIFLACAASQLEQWLTLNWLSLLGSALLTWGLPWLVRPLLAHLWLHLQRWLLRQMLEGVLAHRDRLRRLAFGLFSRLT